MIQHSKILQAIFSHSETNPFKTAVISTDGQHISYSDLVSNIHKAASFLRLHNVEIGSRVMLSAQKEVDFIYFYFGAHLIGAVNVVVDAKNNKEHMDYIASVVKPALALGMDMEIYRSIQFKDLELSDYKEFTPLDKVDLSSDDTADVMFTSGTTGFPKGVMLSHDNIFSSASNINMFIGNGADDIELLGLPICHSFGLGRMRCNMLAGGSVVLHNGFANLKSVFDSFEKFNITGFGMVPAIWAYIKRFSGTRIAKYASQIRYIEIGSAAMPLEDKELLCRLFPTTRICMHYGLTEASRSLFMEFHENSNNLISAGKPVNESVKVKIIKEDNSEADEGEEGEICIKGNMVMKSYYLNQDNDGVFIDGYFRTGDWGRMSSDGNIYLVARKKELINIGGKKVSPIEIEDALKKVGVGDSMCIGIPDPDGVLGEVPKAMLLKGTFSKNLTDIKFDLSKILENYKMPRVYEIVDSIPKTNSGKKKRTI